MKRRVEKYINMEEILEAKKEVSKHLDIHQKKLRQKNKEEISS